MNDENKTKRAIIYGITAAFCVLVLTIGGCVSHANDLTARAIKSGADPIKTVCAMATSTVDPQICMAAALSDGKGEKTATKPNA